MSEVLRLLSMSSQTGALVVEQLGFTGMIFLQAGQIVHAVADGLEGIDALNLLTQHRQADFAFNEGFTTPTLSLSEFPTGVLIDKLKKSIDALKAREDAIPSSHDYPFYLSEKSVPGLVAQPDELNLLLLADGQHSVADIAILAGRNLSDVLVIMGKFTHVGMIEIRSTRPVPLATAKSPSSTPADYLLSTPPAAPLPVAKPPKTDKPARYWRGKRIN